MNREIEERVSQIVDFAESTNREISYEMVLDILQDKGLQVSSEEINMVIEKLEEQGIEIITSADEGYDADATGIDFIPAEVNIMQRPINVYNLMERLENDEINLSPDFQRNSNLWTDVKQSRLIESLMLKIPIPAFYFNATVDDEWIVIDGLQRLSAFKNYLVGEGKDKKKKRFSGLQYLKEFEGLSFDELPRQYIRRIKETVLVAYTVEQGTPDKVVYNIFQRINTGGMILTDQEIRHALYPGYITKLMEKMSKIEEFLIATQHAISSKRMLDQEYVLRYLAFTNLDIKTEYKGNIDEFLIKEMKLVNATYNIRQENKTIAEFKRVMRNCEHVFGRYAFRKYNTNGKRGPINKAIFEIWCILFHKYTDKELAKIIENKEAFRSAFCNLIAKKEFSNALKAGDPNSVSRRIEMALKMMKEFL